VVDLNQRIEAIHKCEVLAARAFVVGLWFAMIFVAIATGNLAPAAGARMLQLCRETGGNSLAAFCEHVDLGLIRPRGQG